jgi:hypothetical protein
VAQVRISRILPCILTYSRSRPRRWQPSDGGRTIDRKNHAGHVASLVRGKKQRSRRDLPGAAQAIAWDGDCKARTKLRCSFLRRDLRVDGRCVDRARDEPIVRSRKVFLIDVARTGLSSKDKELSLLVFSASALVTCCRLSADCFSDAMVFVSSSDFSSSVTIWKFSLT